jgi:signal transduction histidine kinase
VPSELPPVQVDVERINEVLHNLLNNALRHTPEGGTITIKARSGENLQIAVQDTGEGITAEHLPNVFERFDRADYGRSRQAGGTGLGLAIAKAIIEAHDGEISVSSPGIPGQGTTFTIQLPVQA